MNLVRGSVAMLWPPRPLSSENRDNISRRKINVLALAHSKFHFIKPYLAKVRTENTAKRYLRSVKNSRRKL